MAAAAPASKRKRASGRRDKPLAVLITGATSGLGRELVKHMYYDQGIRMIIAVARDAKPYFFEQYDSARFHYVRADITRTRELKNLFFSDVFKDARVDAVVHMAIRNRPEELRSQGAHRLNITGTRNILEFALDTESIRTFVFHSSHIVYRADPLNPVYVDEEAELNFDIDATRWIKDRVDADLLCRSKMEDPRLNIIVLRFANLIGRGMRRYFNSFLHSRVAFHPAGFDPMVNLLHPRDAIRAVRLALAQRELKGVFNIPGKETGPLSAICRINGTSAMGLPAPSAVRLAHRLQRLVGATQFNVDVDMRRLYYPCLLDGTRAKTELGYEPTTHVELG